MLKLERLKYDKTVTVIYAGEHYVSNNDEYIETLLGSCIAVCLYDPSTCISGMNHFMLSGKNKEHDEISGKYGTVSINNLIKEMMDLGANAKNIVAKVFGGGHVLRSSNNGTNVPNENVRLAMSMLEIEDIPIAQYDVGDNYSRRIVMDSKNGKVFCKKTEIFNVKSPEPELIVGEVV